MVFCTGITPLVTANLNLLGLREPEVYGHATLADLEAEVREEAESLGVPVEFFQSNHEGALIDRLHQARGAVSGALLNAGGLSHTSVSLRDAVAGVRFSGDSRSSVEHHGPRAVSTSGSDRPGLPGAVAA